VALAFVLMPEGYAHNGDAVQRDAVGLPDSESGRRFNSAFVSLFSGLQTLIVKSRLLTGEKYWRTATNCKSEATHHFRMRGENYRVLLMGIHLLRTGEIEAISSR
jgi:hypothetical protein